MWDVGGQKSLRSYWRNYFECTDGLIWVVDSADKRRLDDCRNELHVLLKEEVRFFSSINGNCSDLFPTHFCYFLLIVHWRYIVGRKISWNFQGPTPNKLMVKWMNGGARRRNNTY